MAHRLTLLTRVRKHPKQTKYTVRAHVVQLSPSPRHWLSEDERSINTRRAPNVAVLPCAPSGLRGGTDGGCQAPAHGAGAACPDLGVGDGLSEGPAPRAEERGAASRPEQGECCCRSNAARWPVGSAPVAQPPFAPWQASIEDYSAAEIGRLEAAAEVGADPRGPPPTAPRAAAALTRVHPTAS